ncbi:fluoride efflux transporter FluC [Nesterenkonia cremea]|uniref:Fluoride-specific ion channel FluC n=1 Tax=Nesterenkonia cremea TaxID=1882340 RepID=A0A917AMJ0_9MICC|nr:CrcB family protein [Nesterenkonia cremea]GGE61469.1 hypothetical protein GCM10011401_05450 [Nesterenkonia cremea]
MTASLTLAVLAGVALGGAAGAVLRLLLDRLLPFGILAANTLACLALGFLFGAFSAHGGEGQEPADGIFSEPLAAVLSFGLLGALSTFATVSLRVAQLWMNDQKPRAISTWTVHVVLGFAAAAAGVLLSGWL